MDVGKISEQEICQHSAAGALVLHIQMQQEEGAINGKGGMSRDSRGGEREVAFLHPGEQAVQRI